ncbi:Reverse transcriptase [Theobroma cacao]|nr:Reverse transcriptase [Theobroma cacao]
MNETWDVMELLEGKSFVGCKWVFTIKYKSDGEIERHMACLVAKGFTQVFGVDYTETFAPVARLNTIRVLLSLATNLDWVLHQMDVKNDVKNALLSGELDEEVYMDLPPSFEEAIGNKKICRLKKSLYGLKLLPRAWFDHFAKSTKRYGYQQGQTDHTLFFKHSQDGKKTILIVYVDDIILTEDDTKKMERLKKTLRSEFEIKNLGQLRYFLGMEVAKSKKDIAFVVSVVSQYMHSPSEGHLEADNRILWYLKSTLGKGLFFKKNEMRSVEAFTDEDWASLVEDKRSASGCCT